MRARETGAVEVDVVVDSRLRCRALNRRCGLLGVQEAALVLVHECKHACPIGVQAQRSAAWNGVRILQLLRDRLQLSPRRGRLHTGLCHHRVVRLHREWRPVLREAVDVALVTERVEQPRVEGLDVELRLLDVAVKRLEHALGHPVRRNIRVDVEDVGRLSRHAHRPQASAQSRRPWP